MSAAVAVCVGAKGGCGVTTLVAAAARELRRECRTALVDADFSGRRSVATILDARSELDLARGAGSIARADVGGITVCELADRYDAAFTVQAAAVDVLLGALASYDAIVVDAPQPFAAAVRPFVTHASRVVVVVEPTLLGLAGARTLLNDLLRFGIPRERLAIVVNHRDEDGDVTRSEIERVLDMRVALEVPPLESKGGPAAIRALAKLVREAPRGAALDDLGLSSAVPLADRRHEVRRTHDASGADDARREAIKRSVHEALLGRVDLVAASRAHTDEQKLAELRASIESIAGEILAETPEVTSADEAARLRAEILNEELGFGPLEALMQDPDVTEIMVNGPDRVYIERFGKIEKTNRTFVNDEQVRLVIERIVAPLGRRVDESSPMVDARLKDGSRVNAIIEPLAIDGATLTIRRFGKKRIDVKDLIALGSVSEPVLDLLRAAVEARLNIVVSGGTGSGKTTFLNVLSSFLPARERIVTIEDAAELLLDQEHVVRLESRPPNVEGRGHVAIRDLLRNALRMRPDRIIIGECRGAEALDMLQAMNTGHDGSITTIHANSPRDSLARIETMVLMAGFDLPVRAIREQVSNALDMVIHTARMRDGSRKVVSVSEVVGMEGDVVTMQELVHFAQRGIDKEGKVLGEFQYSGVQPACLQRFAEYGVTYDARALSTLKIARAS